MRRIVFAHYLFHHLLSEVNSLPFRLISIHIRRWWRKAMRQSSWSAVRYFISIVARALRATMSAGHFRTFWSSAITTGQVARSSLSTSSAVSFLSLLSRVKTTKNGVEKQATEEYDYYKNTVSNSSCNALFDDDESCGRYHCRCSRTCHNWLFYEVVMIENRCL